jgi:hypothetical protein
MGVPTRGARLARARIHCDYWSERVVVIATIPEIGGVMTSADWRVRSLRDCDFQIRIGVCRG